MAKVLVTGGAGFVGRHLIESLLQRGDDVYCVDNLAPLTGAIDPKTSWPFYNPFDFDSFHFYEEDCRDYFAKNKTERFDLVYHLAALVGGRLVIEQNPLAVAVDLAIDASLWQWSLTANPKKVICFSSSAAYPISMQTKENYKILKETDIDFSKALGVPDMSYGWAKLTHEYLAKLAHERHGIKSVVFRPFSGYGEDQDLTYPFPSICRRALEEAGKNKFMVWGSGEQLRDFIHIKDCVRGILTMVDKIDDAGAVNLSTGILTSFKEFAHLATELLGYAPNIFGSTDKPEGVYARGGDTKKQEQLGFKAQISFTDGIRKGIAFQEDRLRSQKDKKAS